MRILIIHQTHPALNELLQAAGMEVETRLNLTRNQILECLPNYEGLIVRSALKIDAEVINAGKNLTFIGRLGAGMENIDTEYAKQKGMLVFNAPEGNRNAVAEHALGMMLSLLNQLKKADSEVRQGIWNRNSNWGTEIEGKTIGIIGFGNTGSSFAKKLMGFDARIIAYDKYKTGFSNAYVEEVDMNELFQKADIVSLHVPLQNDTYHLVNQSFLNQFRKEIYLINTSRGAVVNTADLVSSLQSGKVKGACLDVLEYEGMSFEAIENQSFSSDFNFLAQCNKVILSPHIAGWTFESYEKLSIVLANKIIQQC
jgi:D-3-phosphoglycerate dehydrogenase